MYKKGSLRKETESLQLAAQNIAITTNLTIISNSKVSKVGDLSREWAEGSLFNSYYTEV